MTLTRKASLTIGGLAVSGLAWFGLTQSPSNVVKLSATAPTTLEDGTPLVDLVAIRVYRRLDAGAYAVLATDAYDTEGGSWQYTDPGMTSGTWCYVVTSVRATGAESVFSNEACKVIDTKKPAKITDLASS